MNDKFYTLKKEKQDRMINAALKIFALDGYKKSSTDDIVKEAAISKGLLFHYFESKAGTYDFVYSYSARYYAMELQGAVALREKDLFVLLQQVETAKCVMLKNYPYMSKFLKRMGNEQEDIVNDYEQYKELYLREMQEIYNRADLTRIKESVDVELLIRSMEYTMDGLLESAMQQAEINIDAIQKEAIAYLEMMRIQFTKEEFL